MRREYYIDNIRIALTALVIMHHSAIAYGASGGWCYISADTITGWTQLMFSAFLSVNQAFFMSLFFFISAYFTPESLDKKGLKKYLSDRLLRLGLPLLLYSIFINPILNYFILIHLNQEPTNLIDYIINSNVTNPNTSHLWFILALLIFECCYALFRFLFKSIKVSISDQLPSPIHVFLFILITGLLAFLLRTVYSIGGRNIMGLQLGYFVLYIAMYVVGIIAGRKKWLDKLRIRTYLLWILLAIILIPFILLAWIDVSNHPNQLMYYVGGFNGKALFLAYWEAFVCVGISVLFLAGFKKYVNTSTKISFMMSSDSYTAYIIHPIIIVSLTILFEIIALQPLYKLIMVSILSVSFSFSIAHVIRLIPGTKKII